MSVRREDKPLKTERIQLMIDPQLLGAIDDWRFAHRIYSRSEAVRLLCGAALASHDLAHAALLRASHEQSK